MPNEPMPPEALDWENVQKRFGMETGHHVIYVSESDYDALVRSYRAMETELKVTRRALEFAAKFSNKYTPFNSDSDHWLSEARAEEEKRKA